jgi:hypothetical protein
MPSANPDLTAIHQLPTPTPPDPPDIPGDMKALADKIDPLIPRIYNGQGSVPISNSVGKVTVDLSPGGFKATPYLAVQPKPNAGVTAVYMVVGNATSATSATVEARRVDGGGPGGTCFFEFIAISYPPHA